MRLLIGLLSIVLLLSGCKKELSPVVSTTTEKTTSDSTIVKETVRLVEVKVPGDSVPYAVQIECDPITNKPKPFQFQKSGKQASVNMALDGNGRLTGVAACAEMQQKVEVKDREINRLRKEYQALHETKLKVVHRPPWYDVACRWITGLLLLVLLLIYLFKRFLKPIQNVKFN